MLEPATKLHTAYAEHPRLACTVLEAALKLCTANAEHPCLACTVQEPATKLRTALAEHPHLNAHLCLPPLFWCVLIAAQHARGGPRVQEQQQAPDRAWVSDMLLQQLPQLRAFAGGSCAFVPYKMSIVPYKKGQSVPHVSIVSPWCCAALAYVQAFPTCIKAWPAPCTRAVNAQEDMFQAPTRYSCVHARVCSCAATTPP